MSGFSSIALALGGSATPPAPPEYFVAGSVVNYTVSYSIDQGQIWTPSSTYAGSQNIANGVCHGDVLDRWVMTISPFAGGVAISNDRGHSWTAQNAGMGENPERCRFSFGAYLIGTNNFSIFRSTTGVGASWSRVSSGHASYGLWVEEATLGLVVSCGTNSGSDSRTRYSLDGISWTNGGFSGLIAGILRAIAYDSERGLWFTVDSSGRVFTTNDVISGVWTQVSTLVGYSSGSGKQFAFAPGGFGSPICLCDGGHVWLSLDDGATWAMQTMPVIGLVNGRDMIWSDSASSFIAVGSTIFLSADGASWSLPTSVPADSYGCVGKALQ